MNIHAGEDVTPIKTNFSRPSMLQNITVSKTGTTVYHEKQIIVKKILHLERVVCNIHTLIRELAASDCEVV